MPLLYQVPFRHPLVSVKMITYNHEPYIRTAVESVLNQEVDFGVELIIGEDCSTDGTREVVREYQRKYPEHVKIVTAEANVGAKANARRVQKACLGEFHASCEGDDYWHDPTKLAKQIAFLQARPDYAMVHSHCHRYDVTKRRLLRDSFRTSPGLDDAKAYEDILLGRRSPMTPSVVARGEKLNWVVENCPECKDPRWPMGDTQRWLELARLGSIGCIHESLATVNYLPESATQSRDTQKRLRFYLKARELKLHYLKKYPVSAGIEQAVREKLALTLLFHSCEAGDRAHALEMYREFVAQRGGATWRARWLLWGAGAGWRRRMIRPLIAMDNVTRRLKIRYDAKQR